MGLFNIFKTNKTKNIKGLTAGDIFKDEKTAVVIHRECKDCEVYNICLGKNLKLDYFCKFSKIIPEYDGNKESILLFDDNLGVISFLEDDLLELEEDGFIDLSNYNILRFGTADAGFNLQASLNSYSGLNIKYAIFDITVGGSIYDDVLGNIVLDGVDLFIAVKDYNPDLKYLFFTGNKLNPYIKKNKEIIEKYKKYTSEDIQDHIIYKTTISQTDRKNYLKEMLT